MCCLSLPSVFYTSMVDSLEVRIACPSISFLFARLEGSLGVFPYLENFVFEGNCLSVVLGDLLPLLRQSLNWFEGLVRREVMSEVRSSELEIGLSSNGDPVEGDIAVSTPQEVRAFYALREACGLDAETVNRFKDRFQFPARVRVRLPKDEDRACHFFPGEVCFYESSRPSPAGLGSPSTRSLWNFWPILVLLRGSSCPTRRGS